MMKRQPQRQVLDLAQTEAIRNSLEEAFLPHQCFVTSVMIISSISK
jgi:hypothetical protein